MNDSPARQSVILLIEDESADSSPCRALIESIGATCVPVKSLEQAETVLDQNAPDVVVVDYDLPDGTGIDLISHLRQGLDDRSTPILLLTGEIDPHELERAVMMGIYAFLAKPFNSEEFVKLVSSAIHDEAERIRNQENE
jgi:DNA-binding NtrC family response regulator